MKANGISSLRMAIPRFCFPSVWWLFSWVELGMGASRRERSFKQLLIRVANTQSRELDQRRHFTTGFFDLLIYADKVDAKNNRMNGVFLYDERDPKNPMIIVAREEK